MLSGSKLSFRGITRAIFTRLRKKAAKHGLSVPGPAGEAVKDGVRIEWTYDAGAQRLEVECVRAPFWIDAARVNHRLSQEIESTLASDRAA